MSYRHPIIINITKFKHHLINFFIAITTIFIAWFCALVSTLAWFATCLHAHIQLMLSVSSVARTNTCVTTRKTFSTWATTSTYNRNQLNEGKYDGDFGLPQCFFLACSQTYLPYFTGCISILHWTWLLDILLDAT